MEGHLQRSPNLGKPIDSDDTKYVSGLSTILVATIQEAKDRISQIEYIFCSQLFPNFQSKSKSLQKIYSEARKAAEDACKEKENDLILQVERLELEKKQALEENLSLKLELETPSKEHVEKTNQLLAKVRSQQLEIDELERKIRKKSEEVDEGMELQSRLLQVVQSKASAIVNTRKQLKENEEKRNELLAEVNSLHKKVDDLQDELRRKAEEVAEGKELPENLFKKIESLGSEIVANKRQLDEKEKEKASLITKLKCLEDNARRLQEELEKKIREVEDGRKLQSQLLQQIDLKNTEMVRNRQQLEESEKEKKLLLAKVTALEGKINKIEVNLGGRNSKVAEESDSYKKLLQQIDDKTSELLAEKKKRLDTTDAYKKLKSQYNYLWSKLQQQNSIASLPVPPDTDKEKRHIGLNGRSEDEKGAKLIKTSSSDSPTSSFPIAPKCPPNAKSAPVVGSKRPASCWRDTRSRQCLGGADPHDDFLDTPLENIRENMNKALTEEVRDPIEVQKDLKLDSSDDETQDMNADRSPQKQQMPVPKASRSGFKYVEPVRKKADRENLKGIECKQCKKFYDAVLPNGGGSDTKGNQQNLRCEHQEGVSRHRYKYVPPLTPEGFWNIGFESEMS